MEVLLVILTSNINILVFFTSIYLQFITNWYLSAIYLQINTITKLGIIILLQNLFYLLF